MIYTGMIFQYNEALGSGLIMLFDGEKKEFTKTDWIDAINAPAVGQKISYESMANKVYIKLFSEEDANKESLVQEQGRDEDLLPQSEEESLSVDEYIEYYISNGFKVLRDVQNDASRTVTLRFYKSGDFGEAIITQNGSKINIEQTLNGEKLSLK